MSNSLITLIDITRRWNDEARGIPVVNLRIYSDESDDMDDAEEFDVHIISADETGITYMIESTQEEDLDRVFWTPIHRVIGITYYRISAKPDEQ